MEPALLLFDIDGTLLRTNGAGMRAMNLVAARLFGEGFRWDGIETAGHLDPLIFAEAATINRLGDDPAHHQNFHDHYIRELEREITSSNEAVRIMPGVLELLEQLQQREARAGDVVLGMLTGNYTAAVPIKLRAVGIEQAWFGITAFGDEGRTRPDLVALAMRKYQQRHGRPIAPKRVVVIGDTPRDIACAHAHGCLALAVATGGFSRAQLAAAGADAAVEDLTDASPLWQLLGEAARVA